MWSGVATCAKSFLAIPIASRWTSLGLDLLGASASFRSSDPSRGPARPDWTERPHRPSVAGWNALRPSYLPGPRYHRRTAGTHCLRALGPAQSRVAGLAGWGVSRLSPAHPYRAQNRRPMSLRLFRQGAVRAEGLALESHAEGLPGIRLPAPDRRSARIPDPPL